MILKMLVLESKQRNDQDLQKAMNLRLKQSNEGSVLCGPLNTVCDSKLPKKETPARKPKKVEKRKDDG